MMKLCVCVCVCVCCMWVCVLCVCVCLEGNEYGGCGHMYVLGIRFRLGV